MAIFRHTPDDYIFFDSDSMPLSFFLTLEAAYALPAGMTSREYLQGSYHIVSDGSTSQNLGTTYAAGDGYITNKAAYIAAYAAYLATDNPASLADAKELIINRTIDYATTKKEAYVVTSGHTFFSTEEFLTKLVNEFNAFTRAGSLPALHYLNDINYVQIPSSAISNLSDVGDNIISLWRLCDLNIDVHRAAINALGTINAVLAYDYTTGWPTVPYDPTLTLEISYAANVNADYSAGAGAGTAVGGAAIASSWLDLTHSDARYVQYDAHLNADSQQLGTIKFTLKPGYSGTPASNMTFFSIAKAGADSTNLIEIYHANADGKIYISIKDDSDVAITLTGLAVWNPTSGTEYEFVFNYDVTGGDTRLLIDKVQLGSTIGATGTRSADITILRVGTNYNDGALTTSNFSIKDFSVYNI